MEKKKEKIGRDVAEQMMKNIYDELRIDISMLDEEDEKDSHKKMVSAIMQGRLEYENEVFTLNLLKPLKFGSKKYEKLVIEEPTGVQLRAMAQIKKKNDDVGKAMAVLGDVTGLGIQGMNKLKSRDMMLGVSVISLFL